MARKYNSFAGKLRWWSFWGRHFSHANERLTGMNILEVGSGPVKRLGVTTLDFNPEVKPDILHDLNQTPWPIEESSFDAVYMFSVIEHISDPITIIEECHRILKSNGKIYLLTPHFSSTASYLDLTHKWHFSGRSFDYFIPNTDVFKDYSFYSRCRFTLIKRIISLQGVWNYIPLMQWLANRFLPIWEDYFCFIVRGSGIYIELEKQD